MHFSPTDQTNLATNYHLLQQLPIKILKFKSSETNFRSDNCKPQTMGDGIRGKFEIHLTIMHHRTMDSWSLINIGDATMDWWSLNNTADDSLNFKTPIYNIFAHSPQFEFENSISLIG